MALELYDLVGRISVDRAGEEKALTDVQKRLLEVRKAYEAEEAAAKKAAATSSNQASIAEKNFQYIQSLKITESARSQAQAEKDFQFVQSLKIKESARAQKEYEDGVKAAEKTAQVEITQAEKAATRITQIRKQMDTIAEQQAARQNSFIGGTGRGLSLGTLGSGEKLGAESQKAQQDLQALEAEAKSLDATFVSSGKSIESTGTSLAALAGPAAVAIGAMAAVGVAELAVATGLFDLSKNAAAYGDEIYKAAQKTGLSTEFLSVAKLKVEEMGGSFQAFTQGLARTEIALSKSLSNPSAEAAKAFTVLGLSARDLKNSLPDERILLVGQALAKVTDVAERNRIAVALGSKGFLEQIGTLEALTSNYDELHKRTESLGLLWSGEMANAAHDFNVQVADLDLKAKGFVITIGERLLPAMGHLLTSFDDATKGAGGLANILGGAVAYWLDSNAKALEKYVHWYHELIAAAKTYGDFDKQTQASKTFTVGGLYSKYMGEMEPNQAPGRTLTSGDAASFATADRNSTEFPEKKSRGESDQSKLDRQLKVIRDGNQELQNAYQEAHDQLEASLKNNQTSLEAYESAAEVMENERLTKLKFAAHGEIDIIQASGVAQDEKAAKVADINKSILVAEKTAAHDLAQVHQKAFDEEHATTEARQNSMAAIRKSAGEQELEALRYAGEQQVGAQLEIQQKIDALESDELDKREQRLRIKQVLMSSESEGYKRLSYQLGEIEAERGAMLQRHFNDESHAFDDSLRDWTNYFRQIEALEQEAADQASKYERGQLERAKSLGYATGDFAKAQTNRLDKNDEDLNYEQQKAQRRIQLESATANTTGEVRKDIEEQFRILMEGDEQAHQQRIISIEDRAQEEMYKKQLGVVQTLRQGFESSFDDAFGHIKDGFGAVLKTMILDFTKFIAEMIIQAEAAKIAKALFPDSAASGNGSGSGWLGKILKMAVGAAAGAATGGTALGGKTFAPWGGMPTGFATGGDVLPNTGFIAGENGPEFIRSGMGGAHVFNNNDTSKMMGGDTNVSITITGVKDAGSFLSPQSSAQVKAMIRDAVVEASRRAK